MKRVMIITLTCLLAVSGIGFAKGLGGIGILKMPRDKWWQIPEVAEKLELTGEKQQELDDLFVHNQRRMIDLRNDVQKERFELGLILDQQNFDESACVERFKELQSARTNLADERFKSLIKIRKMLGLDRYRQLRKTFKEHRMPGMKRQRRPIGYFKGEGW
jgi:Spy/CpxP family protein refolding chaperone